MEQVAIDAFLIQESWVVGNISFTIGNHLILHHGADTVLIQRGSQGVTIILGPYLKNLMRIAAPLPQLPHPLQLPV